MFITQYLTMSPLFSFADVIRHYAIAALRRCQDVFAFHAMLSRSAYCCYAIFRHAAFDVDDIKDMARGIMPLCMLFHDD